MLSNRLLHLLGVGDRLGVDDSLGGGGRLGGGRLWVGLLGVDAQKVRRHRSGAAPPAAAAQQRLREGKHSLIEVGQDASLTVGRDGAHGHLGVRLHPGRQGLTELGHQDGADPGEDDVGDARREGLDEPVGDPLADQRGHLIRGRRGVRSDPLPEVLELIAHRGDAEGERRTRAVVEKATDPGAELGELVFDTHELLDAPGQAREVRGQGRDRPCSVADLSHALTDLTEAVLDGPERCGDLVELLGNGGDNGGAGVAQTAAQHVRADNRPLGRGGQLLQTWAESVHDSVAESLGVRDDPDGLDLGLQCLDLRKQGIER